MKLKIEFYNLGTLHIIIGPGLVLGIFFILENKALSFIKVSVMSRGQGLNDYKCQDCGRQHDRRSKLIQHMAFFHK